MKIIIFLTIITPILPSHINSLNFSQKLLKDYKALKTERNLEKTHNYKCNKELLLSYGFEGPPTPEISSNKYCPKVKFSCCLKKDIENSHNFFLTTKKKIERYYETYLFSLQYLLGFNSQIYNLAHFHQQSQNEECRRISQNYLKSGMDNFESEIMYDIFGEGLSQVAELRKGFFCVVCDGANHPFFTDLNSANPFVKNSILFGRDFCRKLVSKTGKASFYLVNRMKRYLEDLSGLIKCQDDSLQSFKFEVQGSEDIELCYRSKDKDDFFSLGCQNYCQGFKLTQPSKVLDGDVEQLKKFVFLVMENRKNVFKDPNSNSLNNDVQFMEDILKFNYDDISESQIFYNAKHTNQYLENFNTAVTFGKGMDPFESVENNNYGIVFMYNSFVRKSVLCLILLLI